MAVQSAGLRALRSHPVSEWEPDSKERCKKWEFPYAQRRPPLCFWQKRQRAPYSQSKKDPLDGAYEIWLLGVAADHPEELALFGGLDQDFNIPQVLEECELLLSR